MKIIIAISLFVTFLLLNTFLLLTLSHKDDYIKRIEQENSDLNISNANYMEANHYMSYITQKNRTCSYKPIFFSEKVSSYLSKQPENSYLLVRYDINTCSTCLEKFFLWLNGVIKEVGPEKVLLFQVGKNDSPHIEAILPKKCAIIPIVPEDMYSKEYLSTETPYLFVYKKGERYPFLFSLYPMDLIGLNELYQESFVNYFKIEPKPKDAEKITGVEQCDTALYIRNAVEVWDDYVTKKDLKVGQRLTLPTGKIATIRTDIPAGSSIRYPNSSYSEGNCCEKAHLDKEYRFP